MAGEGPFGVPPTLSWQLQGAECGTEPMLASKEAHLLGWCIRAAPSKCLGGLEGVMPPCLVMPCGGLCSDHQRHSNQAAKLLVLTALTVLLQRLAQLCNQAAKLLVLHHCFRRTTAADAAPQSGCEAPHTARAAWCCAAWCRCTPAVATCGPTRCCRSRGGQAHASACV